MFRCVTNSSDKEVSMSPAITEHELIKLKRDLRYEKGTITATTIYKTDIQTVAGMAFDRGQSIMPCISATNLMLHVLEGQAEVMIAGKNFDLTEGENILMPKDKIHALFAKTKLKLALVKGKLV